MILNFGDETTADVYHGRNTKRARSFPNDVISAARRRLDALNSAHDLRDLENNPGNRLEKKKGVLKNNYAVWVNKQWRIVFLWENGNAKLVRLMDYHHH